MFFKNTLDLSVLLKLKKKKIRQGKKLLPIFILLSIHHLIILATCDKHV